MPDEGDAAGEAYLAAVGVATEDQVGAQRIDDSQLIGEMGEHDARQIGSALR